MPIYGYKNLQELRLFVHAPNKTYTFDSYNIPYVFKKYTHFNNILRQGGTYSEFPLEKISLLPGYDGGYESCAEYKIIEYFI